MRKGMHLQLPSSTHPGNASVRRPHREAWEDVEGTELDDVCDRLRRAECTDTSAVRATPPLSEEPAAASHGGPPTAQEGAPQACTPSAADVRNQPSSAGEPDCLAASPQHDAAHARGHEMQQSSPEAACSLPLREAGATAAAAAVAAAASWEPSSSSRRGAVRGDPDANSASSLRRAPSTFSASLPTAPYERLLFQRQQQRRLLQQQATLRSFPSLSSDSGSVETLAAALQDKRQRQQQLQQQEQEKQQDQQQQQQQQHQQQHEAAPLPSEACVSPSRVAVAAELRGPCLPPALRLQLLQEALWTAPSAASSSLGRSERKWWSMNDRNLEAFMFSHHRTFLRRLGR
ncbi:hypothetical protein Emag_002544 [Eimeria magna]